jgi:hypothetical protein
MSMLRAQVYPVDGTFTIKVTSLDGRPASFVTRTLRFKNVNADGKVLKPWDGWEYMVMRKIDEPSEIRLDSHPECFALMKMQGNLNMVVLKEGARACWSGSCQRYCVSYVCACALFVFLKIV